MILLYDDKKMTALILDTFLITKITSLIGASSIVKLSAAILLLDTLMFLRSQKNPTRN